MARTHMLLVAMRIARLRRGSRRRAELRLDCLIDDVAATAQQGRLRVGRPRRHQRRPSQPRLRPRAWRQCRLASQRHHSRELPNRTGGRLVRYPRRMRLRQMQSSHGSG